MTFLGKIRVFINPKYIILEIFLTNQCLVFFDSLIFSTVTILYIPINVFFLEISPYISIYKTVITRKSKLPNVLLWPYIMVIEMNKLLKIEICKRFFNKSAAKECILDLQIALYYIAIYTPYIIGSYLRILIRYKIY